jgi:hypothetical protein
MLAGVPGFEPGNAGIKTPCLTAWLHPNRFPPPLRPSPFAKGEGEGGGGSSIRGLISRVTVSDLTL